MRLLCISLCRDNGTCVDESLFGSPEYDAFGNRDKAEFRQESKTPCTIDLRDAT